MTNKVKNIKLNQEEEIALRDIYLKKDCPKKCHTMERRIWFIPEELVDSESNYDYTCCINCYYNKSELNLLNHKYNKDNLVPILSENLSMNCDESINEDDVSVNLENNFLLSIYQDGNKSGFKKLEKNTLNSYNIYLDDVSGTLNVVLYKKNNNIDNNENIIDNVYTLYANLHYDTISDENLNDNLIIYTKSYVYNGELCLTLNKILTIHNSTSQKIIKTNVFKYNFFDKSHETIVLNYFTSKNSNLKSCIKINLIYNKSNYKKKLLDNVYMGFYNNKQLSI